MTVPDLPPAGAVRVVVDTGTFDEIDDEFAVANHFARSKVLWDVGAGARRDS